MPNNAFYCPDGHFIAYDATWLQSLYDQLGDGAVYIVIPHEFGHAVQNQLQSTHEFTVQSELQADCYAGGTLKGLIDGGRLQAQEGDDAELMANLEAAGDPTDAWWEPGAHGTGPQRQLNFARGLDRGLGPAERADPDNGSRDGEWTGPATPDSTTRSGARGRDRGAGRGQRPQQHRGPALRPLTSAAATGALLLIARRAGAGGPRPRLLLARPGRPDRRRPGRRRGGRIHRRRPAAPHLAACSSTSGPSRSTRARLFEEALLQVPVGTVLLEEVAFRGVLPEPVRLLAQAPGRLGGLQRAVRPVARAARPRHGPRQPGRRPRGHPRLVAGTVATTTLVGLGFHELRKRGGLLAPALLHLATNSLGFLAARSARRHRTSAGSVSSGR